MSAADDRPAVPTENEADALDQQAPAVPEAEEDTGIQDLVQAHGDPLLEEGSEADRLEQDVGGATPADEEDYPRGSAD